MCITFFYTRVTYLRRKQVCLMRHTDVRDIQVSTYTASSFLNRLCGFLSFRLHISQIRGQSRSGGPVEFPYETRYRPTNSYLPFHGWKRGNVFGLTTLTKKRGTVTKLNFRSSYSPQVAGKKLRQPTSFITDSVELSRNWFFSTVTAASARVYPPRVPLHYARRYFYVIVARWISSKGCKSNNQNVRIFLCWNTPQPFRAWVLAQWNRDFASAKIGTTGSSFWKYEK